MKIKHIVIFVVGLALTFGFMFSSKEKPVFAGKATQIYIKGVDDKSECYSQTQGDGPTVLMGGEIMIEVYENYVVFKDKQKNDSIIVPRERLIKIVGAKE